MLTAAGSELRCGKDLVAAKRYVTVCLKRYPICAQPAACVIDVRYAYSRRHVLRHGDGPRDRRLVRQRRILKRRGLSAAGRCHVPYRPSPTASYRDETGSARGWHAHVVLYRSHGVHAIECSIEHSIERSILHCSRGHAEPAGDGCSVTLFANRYVTVGGKTAITSLSGRIGIAGYRPSPTADLGHRCQLVTTASALGFQRYHGTLPKRMSIHISRHACAHVCTNVCTRAYTHIHTHVYTARVCTHVRAHVCTLVCTHDFTNVYTHVYTHLYTNPSPLPLFLPRSLASVLGPRHSPSACSIKKMQKIGARGRR